MNSFLSIVLMLQLTGIAWTKPGVEIQQQRLIKVPQNYPRYQATEKTPDTQRILNEIQRINAEFGYIKKEPQISPRIDIESYFYPRPAYHPIHQRYNNGVALQPTIRQLNIEESDPFQNQNYFYPAPYLQLPYSESAGLFQRTKKAENFFLPSKEMARDANSDFSNAVEYSPQYAQFRGQGKLIRDYNREKVLIETVKNIVNEIKENNKSQQLDTAVIIKKIADESRANHLKKHESKLDIFVVSPLKKKTKGEVDGGDIRPGSTKNLSKQKFTTTTTTTTSLPHTTTVNSKTFFNRPKPGRPGLNTVKSKTTEKPQVVVVKDEPQETLNMPEDPPALFKGPFSNFFNNQKEQVVEALRSGGIIIQRLRVREGGIAIAGPGGVATAGSGGTAIVGPGGIALTHPRSLTIAGPGARVFAVPKSVDLERLALRSNARQLASEIEGFVVATGPVIYYNPAAETR